MISLRRFTVIVKYGIKNYAQFQKCIRVAGQERILGHLNMLVSKNEDASI